MTFECKICGFEYSNKTEAEECARKGTEGNPLKVGQRLLLPFEGGQLVRITDLIIAHQSHKPGVRFEFDGTGSVGLLDSVMARQYVVSTLRRDGQMTGRVFLDERLY